MLVKPLRQSVERTGISSAVSYARKGLKRERTWCDLAQLLFVCLFVCFCLDVFGAVRLCYLVLFRQTLSVLPEGSNSSKILCLEFVCEFVSGVIL